MSPPSNSMKREDARGDVLSSFIPKFLSALPALWAAEGVRDCGPASSKIPFLLLLLHRRRLILVDDPALALGGCGDQHLAHDIEKARCIAVDRTGQWITAEG